MVLTAAVLTMFGLSIGAMAFGVFAQAKTWRVVPVDQRWSAASALATTAGSVLFIVAATVAAYTRAVPDWAWWAGIGASVVAVICGFITHLSVRRPTTGFDLVVTSNGRTVSSIAVSGKSPVTNKQPPATRKAQRNEGHSDDD